MFDKIRVAVRIRPPIKREIEKGLPEIWHVNTNNNTIKLNDPEDHRSGEEHTFDHVFGKWATNANIYESLVEPMVEFYLEGYNCSIFAYGQTSSGKTYTINGCANDAGIISRVADSLFKRVNMKPDHKFLFRVSYVEIYNEKIYDLLTTSNAEVKTREDYSGNMILNAKETITATTEEIMQVVAIGKRNRKVHSTNMNINSSRSHAIFRITMECTYIYEFDERVKVCHFDLVDLAGSERLAQAQTSGIHFKEGTFINRSLTALGIVIQQLAENRPHISYRNTKLTFILRNSLGGNAKTLFIVNMTPVPSEDSHITLQFANRAKTIKNKPCINTISSESSLSTKCQKRVENLELELLKVVNQNRDLQTDIEKQEKYVEVLENRIKIINQAFTLPKSSDSYRRHTISYDSHVIMKHVSNDDLLDRSQFPPIDPDVSEIFSDADEIDLPFQTDVDVDLSAIQEDESLEQPQDVDLHEEDQIEEIDLDVIIDADVVEQASQAKPEVKDVSVQFNLEDEEDNGFLQRLYLENNEEEIQEDEVSAEMPSEEIEDIYDAAAEDFVLPRHEDNHRENARAVDDFREMQPDLPLMPRQEVQELERNTVLATMFHQFDRETATRRMKEYQAIVRDISCQVSEQASREFYRVRSCQNLSTGSAEEIPKLRRHKSLSDLKDQYVVCSKLNLSDVMDRLIQLRSVLGEENKLKSINEELQLKITFYNEVLGRFDLEDKYNKSTAIAESLTIENADLKGQIATYDAKVNTLTNDKNDLDQLLAQEVKNKNQLAMALEDKHREVLQLKEEARNLQGKSDHEQDRLSKLIEKSTQEKLKLATDIKTRDVIINEWTAKYNDLKTELDTMVTERHKLQEIMTETSEKNTKIGTKITKLNEEYKNTLEKHINENKMLNNQLKESEEESHKLKDELRQKEKDLAKLKSKESRLRHEVHDLKEQVQDRIVETNQLTKENQKLKAKIGEVPITPSVNQTEIKKLEEKLRTQNVEMELLAAKNEQLKKEILDSKTRYAGKSPERAQNLHDLLVLREQASEYKKIMTELENQLRTNSKKNEEQAKEIVILKRKLGEISITQSEIEKLEDKLKLSQVETNNFKAKSNQLRRELDEFQKKCYENKKKEEQYAREIKKLKETDAENKKIISQFERKIDTEVEKRNTLKQETEHLQKELSSLKKDINTQHMSQFISSQGELILTLQTTADKLKEQLKLKSIEKHYISEEFEKLKRKFQNMTIEQRDKDEKLEKTEKELWEYKQELKITRETLNKLQEDYVKLKTKYECTSTSLFSPERRLKKSIMQDSSRKIQESNQGQGSPVEEEDPIDYKKKAEALAAEIVHVKTKYNKVVGEYNALQNRLTTLRTKYDQLKVVSHSLREQIVRLEKELKKYTGSRSPSPKKNN